MKSNIIAVLVFLAVPVASIAWFHALRERQNRRARVVQIKNTLMMAYADMTNGVAFTNRWPNVCRVFQYTNQHVITGTVYQCAFAADLWDYQAKSNLLAITTNWVFLYVDRNGPVPIGRFQGLPGY